MDVMPAAAVILVLGLLPAATAAAVRHEMSRNRRIVPSTLRLAVWATLQWGGVALVLFVLPLALLPLYVGVIIAGLLVSFLIVALLGRRRDSIAVLNESVRVISRRGGSLADMAEAYSHGDPSVLAGRARRFADAIRRGMPPEQAARQVRLPLDAETVLALEHRGQSSWSEAGQEADDAHRPSGFPASAWPAASQAAYFLTMLVATMLISTFLMLFIGPTLQYASEEFQIETQLSRASDSGQLRWILILPAILGGAFLAWGLLQLAYWITDWRWIARLLPLSGRLLQSRRRGKSLRGLAAAIDAGSEVSQALQMVSAARFRPGENARLHRAAALAASGSSLGGALQKAGLVDRRQRPWIDAAVATGRVAEALRGVAASAERHARVRFESASAIVFPLGVLGCGLVILWVANLVFGSLVELIHALV